MSAASQPSWAPRSDRSIHSVARNVSSRYAAIVVSIVLGLLMLPFNLSHLGAAQYGLWMLVGSITAQFSLLDLGFGGSLVKFVAQYRAHRDARALNEIASTLFFVFAGIGLLAYAAAAAIAFNLGGIFRLSPDQADTGRWLLLIVGAHVALNFPFSIFGAVVSGFQRYDANTVVAMGVSVAAAVVNVAVLTAGYGLVALVAATTAVRIVAFLLYSRNAYRIYPDLRIRPSLVRRRRLREVTGFSLYASIIDWANKLNYQCDTLVIGAFLGSSAVAVWAVAGRVITETQRLTNQLNGVLFPLIVDSDASNRRSRLQRILLEGTRVSLAMVLPISVSLIVLAEPLVRAWVGEDLLGSAPVIQVLALAVAIRVGNATGNTLLKGSGEHRSLAWINMATGVANLALSVLLVRRWGLLGVALGTLIPTATSALFVLYPAACRRAGLPLRAAAQHAIAPTVWPALVMFMGLVVLAELIPPGTLLAVMLHAAAGAALYAGLFAIAIGRHGRATYTNKARQLLGRPGLAPAA